MRKKVPGYAIDGIPIPEWFKMKFKEFKKEEKQTEKEDLKNLIFNNKKQNAILDSQ